MRRQGRIVSTFGENRFEYFCDADTIFMFYMLCFFMFLPTENALQLRRTQSIPGYDLAANSNPSQHVASISSLMRRRYMPLADLR